MENKCALATNKLLSLNRAQRSLLGLWLSAGIVCLWWDDHLQPCLSSAGRHPGPRFFAEHCQLLGEALGITLFLLGVLVFSRHHIVVAVTTLFAVAIASQSSKYFFGRVRPNWSGDITIFFGPLGCFNGGTQMPIDSLPSGHTATAFAMAQFLSQRWPTMKVLWITAAIGVGVSRTLVDVHFPSDVIFGALLGTVAGTWITVFNKRLVLHRFPTISMNKLMKLFDNGIQDFKKRSVGSPTKPPPKRRCFIDIVHDDLVSIVAGISLVAILIWLFLRS